MAPATCLAPPREWQGSTRGGWGAPPAAGPVGRAVCPPHVEPGRPAVLMCIWHLLFSKCQFNIFKKNLQAQAHLLVIPPGPLFSVAGPFASLKQNSFT